MSFTERCTQRLERRLPTLILLFCASQPLMDVLGYWQQQMQVGNALTTALRMLLLVSVSLFGYLFTDRKWIYHLLFAVLAILTGLHVTANLPGGYWKPGSDLANLVRIDSLPIMTVCLISFLCRGGERAYRGMKRGMSAAFGLILLVELLSVATGTNRGTYVKEHIGIIGWFVWGNCQSAILSMMAPLLMCWTLARWRNRLVPILAVSLVTEGALYFLGTRLAFACMIASGFGVGGCLLVLERHRWRTALVLFLMTGLFLAAYPLSPAARRLHRLDEANQSNAQVIRSMEASGQADQSDSASMTLIPVNKTEWDRLEAIYSNFFCDVSVDRFGIQRTARAYNYTLDAVVLGDARVGKRVFCSLTMEDAGFLCRLFGLNVNEYGIHIPQQAPEDTNNSEGSFFSLEAENDILGIYFVLGIAGLVLILGFLAYFFLRVLLRVFQRPGTYLSPELFGYFTAYGFSFVHAWFTTSVLRRNNASVYLSLVLAGIWYLTQKEQPVPSATSVPRENRSAGRREHEAK